MKEKKLIPHNITNTLIFIVTLFSLFISFQITSNNYKDNRHYSLAYSFMKKHALNIQNKGIDTNMYYLVDSPKDSGCSEKGHVKYYLLDKKRYPINEQDSILTDYKYNLVSCKETPKYNLRVIKQEKGLYIQKDRTITEILQTYKTTIGGMEPIYIFLSYVFSSILDYNYFILLMNLIFLVVVFLALKKFTKNYKYMYILLILSDFYIYIYLSNTHRLKLAIIFLLLSYLTYNKTKIIMIISALFSHLQIIIFYLYYLLVTLIHDIKLADILSKKKQYSLSMLFTIALVLYFQDQIIVKISYYLQIVIPYKVATLILIYLIYLFIFKLKDTIKLFVPLAIIVLFVSFFIGSDRINFMLMEFILIVELNRLLNKHKYALFIVVPFLVYSIYKSANYIQLGIQ